MLVLDTVQYFSDPCLTFPSFRRKVSLSRHRPGVDREAHPGGAERGANLVAAYVDTVGDPDKYRAMLSKKFPSIAFTVSKRSRQPVPRCVGRGSVVAKVKGNPPLSI